MWLNNEQVTDSAISAYRKSLLNTCPNHVVIDGLFDESKLDDIVKILQQPHQWQTQRHTYSELYVDNAQWQEASKEQRFVQRDAWQRGAVSSDINNSSLAHDFLSFLRGDEFLAILSRIFNIQLTDINVADPDINTNYFRLSSSDFVEQHADDSPGREVCMLLYLNKDWNHNAGGELAFTGESEDAKPILIKPLYNRCVLFDPSSKGSEHWVKKVNAKQTDEYRFNVVSWYWSE